MRLVFNNTGDTIELEPNKKVFEYYTKQLDDSSRNHFSVASNLPLLAALTQLQESLTIVNDFFKKHFKLDTFDPFISQSLIDQEVLNKLHEEWVKIQYRYDDGICILLGKIDGIIIQHFLYINSMLHIVENGFQWKCQNYIVKVDNELAERVCLNKFESDALDFNRWNISIVGNDQGRQTFDKWRQGDYRPIDIDTGDFEWFRGEIYIDLQRPHTFTPPLEYKEWCKKWNIPAIGTKCGLANIKNWRDNLTEVREIFLKNIKQGNTFTLVNK